MNEIKLEEIKLHLQYKNIKRKTTFCIQLYLLQINPIFPFKCIIKFIESKYIVIKMETRHWYNK